MLKIVRRLMPEFGTTYGPAEDGPFPAVLILHGSEGGLSGWSHRTAVLLAAHGFIAYPHTYSTGGNAWNAGSIRDVPIDRTEEALAALRQFEFCTGKVGLYGVSRGGEHALLLVALMASEGSKAQVDALAAHSAADVVCGAFNAKSYRDSGDAGWKSWDPANRAWSWRGSSEDIKPTTPIPIAQYEGPICLSHGTKDRVWDVEMTKRLQKKLEGRKSHLEVHFDDDEDHLHSSEAENVHNERLITFFHRFLS